MRIVVVGAGGVGGLIGGLLAHGGAEVAFVARGRQLQALRDDGLHVESARGSFHLPRVEASDDPAQLAPADVVLVAVKSWQVAEIAPRLAPLLTAESFAVPLENGVEAAETLAAALGDARVAGGFCAMVSWLDAPGSIRHIGPILKVVLGERGGGTSPRLDEFARQLRAARIDVELSDDITAAAWEKFVFIASFGAVAAAARAPAGIVRSTPETRALLQDAMGEVANLAGARGVRLPPNAVDKALAMVDAMPPESTASMQRDIQGGNPSELPDQCGAVVRMAAESGVPAPIHRSLYAILIPHERAARARPSSPAR